MAGRIRTIKPEILEDEKTLDLSDLAWRLFVSSWVLADDQGDFRASVRSLSIAALGGRIEGVEGAVEELLVAGLWIAYRVRGTIYARNTNWVRHQRVDNAGKPRVPTLEEAEEKYLTISALREPPRTSADRRDSPRFAAVRGSTSDLRPPTNDHRPPTAEQERMSPAAAGDVPQPILPGLPVLNPVRTTSAGGPKKRRTKESDVLRFSVEVREVVRHYATHQPDVTVSKTTEDNVRKMLRQGFTVEKLKAAIDEHQADRWCIDRGLLNLAFLFKEPERLEQYASKAAIKKPEPKRNAFMESVRADMARMIPNGDGSYREPEPESKIRVERESGEDDSIDGDWIEEKQAHG